jgi:hypothetical protein
VRTKGPRLRFALWTTFPESKKHLRRTIVETFGAVYINDHSKPGIMHAPLLVASEEVMPDPRERRAYIERCWVQNTWSASITPHGAYFCEVAAAMACLTGAPGWPVEPGWWKRRPADYEEQVERFCNKCGAAMPLRRRESVQVKDDISPGNLEMLRALGSPKVRRGEYQLYEEGLVQEPEPMFSFAELEYRRKIAAKYDLGLVGYVTPYLPEEATPEQLAEIRRFNAEVEASASAGA